MTPHNPPLPRWLIWYALPGAALCFAQAYGCFTGRSMYNPKTNTIEVGTSLLLRDYFMLAFGLGLIGLGIWAYRNGTRD